MTIDLHTHFWTAAELGPEVFADLDQARIPRERMSVTSAGHLAATAAVDVAVVFGVRAARSGMHVANDTVRAQVAKAPERLIFFTSIDPSEPGFMAELERTHQDLGARGIKIAPIYQGVHPRDPRYGQIFAYAQQHGLPVLTHMATTFSSSVPLEYAWPLHVDGIALDFPDLKIVLAHLGHPWTGETIAVIRRQRNVYADLSALYYRPWQFYQSMRLLVEYGASHKVFFGSDYPFTTPADSLAGVRALNHVVQGSALPPVPEMIIEEILQRDTLALLGLPRP